MPIFPFQKENNQYKLLIKDIKDDLKNGKIVSDERFDLVFPQSLRELSPFQWTPISVIQTALSLFQLKSTSKVLDIGSGPGKYCLVSAMLSKSMFVGVEQRTNLHTIANNLAFAFTIPNVQFLKGNMGTLDWSIFDAFYFYNPFYENLTTNHSIDEVIPKKVDTYFHYLKKVKEKLGSMPKKTQVVTYHSIGGRMPESYKCKEKIKLEAGDLELWIKES